MSGIGRVVTFLFLSGWVWGSPQVPQPRSLGDLTGPWELVVDDHLIQEKQGLVRRYHAFRKHAANPVLEPDRPWEGQVAYLLGTVLPFPDGKGYRMWYHTANPDADPKEQYRNLYAESRDGVHWTKPDLNIVQYRGTGANNIFLDRMRESHIPLVIHTPWDPDPAKEYKLVYYDYGRTDPRHRVSGYYGAWSRDGIHWSPIREEPLFADPGDVGNFVWDPHQERYLGYAKIFVPNAGHRRRAIGLTATTDFLHWPPTQLVLAPDAVDDRWVTADRQHTDFYGLSAFAYESMYLGFLWVFRIDDGHNDGTIHVELVSSRDGIEWKRVEGDRPPLLELGAGGAWDDGMLHTPSQPLVEGDEIKLFYGASDQTHVSPVAGGWGNCAIGLATLRKDGFASLDAGDEVGSFTTRPLRRFTGPLRVNAGARRGWLRVELLDSSGIVIPGYGKDQCDPVTDDGVDQVVRWRGRDQWPESPRPAHLRFYLKNASLYSFRAAVPLELAKQSPLLDVLLDFEGDAETSVEDKRTADGQQSVRLHNSVRVIQDRERAVSGGGAAEFYGEGKTHDSIEIQGTRYLGTHFTLSARVKPALKRRMRLFSNYRGTGDPATGEIIFDFNPNGGDLRLVVNGQTVRSRSVSILTDRDHLMEATYDEGRVRLYLDGDLVGDEQLMTGTSHLYYDRSIVRHLTSPASAPAVGLYLASDLRVGQDLEGRFITHRHEGMSDPGNQLVGLVDEVRVTRRTSGAAGPPLAEPSFIREVGPIRRYGPGGGWGEGGWARSFQAPDGAIYLYEDKKTLDGGKTYVSHQGPSLREVLRIPERVFYIRKGHFFALGGAAEFQSPGLYTVRSWRSRDDLATLQEEESVIRVPGGPPRAREKGEWYGLYFYRDMLELPDGTLMTTMEGNLEQDNLPPTDRRSSSETHYQQRTLTLTSKDQGRSWDYFSTVAAPKPGDPVGEGFTEPSLLHLGEGRLVCVMRTGHFTPLYASWSGDWGKTWTEPVYTGLDRGCDPTLLKLRDGRVLLSYGERFPAGTHLQPRERGALVRFAISENEGKTWRTATVAEKMGSSYSTVIEVEPNVLFVQVDGWFWRVKLWPRQESEPWSSRSR